MGYLSGIWMVLIVLRKYDLGLVTNMNWMSAVKNNVCQIKKYLYFGLIYEIQSHEEPFVNFSFVLCIGHLNYYRTNLCYTAW